MADPVSPADRDDLAAELALGVLEGEERAAALRLTLADPSFAAEVDRWSIRLAPLLAATPGQTPPPHLWAAIEARLSSPEVASLNRRLKVWRRGAIVSGLLAASLALLLVVRPPVSIEPRPTLISQLARPDGRDLLVVRYDIEAGTLHLSRTALASTGKSPELWVIPADGVPRSLGLIPSEGEMKVRPGLDSHLRQGATLAVSLEDPASAPHDAPTSTPILMGKISRL